MIRASQVAEALLRGFKILLRDVALPVFGLYLVARLGQGKFDSSAIPFIATLASAMIGLPIWSRSDERDRSSGGGSGKPKRRNKRITIDFGGSGGDDNDDDPSRK